MRMLLPIAVALLSGCSSSWTRADEPKGKFNAIVHPTVRVEDGGAYVWGHVFKKAALDDAVSNATARVTGTNAKAPLHASFVVSPDLDDHFGMKILAVFTGVIVLDAPAKVKLALARPSGDGKDWHEDIVDLEEGEVDMKVRCYTIGMIGPLAFIPLNSTVAGASRSAPEAVARECAELLAKALAKAGAS